MIDEGKWVDELMGREQREVGRGIDIHKEIAGETHFHTLTSLLQKV